MAPSPRNSRTAQLQPKLRELNPSKGSDELEGLVDWLRSFEEAKGRPLRVLHVGNVANNAYQNARISRTVGIEAHVLSYGGQHVMATPEWEEVELLESHGDDFLPRFSRADLRGYQRPSWFVSGPLLVSVLELGMLQGNPSRWQKFWLTMLRRALILTERTLGPRASHALDLFFVAPHTFLHKVWTKSKMRFGRLELIAKSIPSSSSNRSSEDQRLIDAFDKAFPERTDRLGCDDIELFRGVADHLKNLFQRYDVVQCYAIDPILALLNGVRPYVAFEHGTLRCFTMDDSPTHRLNALAYREADHVFITNGDCLAYAQKLGIPRFSPTIHAINVDQHRKDYGEAARRLRAEADGDVILFCPTRHDWKIKGTDQFIRALPLLKRQTPGRVKLILIEWGEQVEESKRLIHALACDSDVIWKKSMCRITMIKHIHAADVVFDQMVLPVFGSTAPQTIAAGVPVIGSYVPEETEWLIPEPAPILSAFSSEDICDAVRQALDPTWLADYRERASRWIDNYHSENIVIRDHIRVYRQVLSHTPTGEDGGVVSAAECSS